jgi:hypothetical protein
LEVKEMKLTKLELEIFNFARKGETQRIFNTVYIDKTQLIATDGYIMAVLQLEQPDRDWEPALVSRDWVKELCAKVKDKVELFCDPDGNISTDIIGHPTTTPLTGYYAPISLGVDTILSQKPTPNHAYLDTFQLHQVLSYVKKFKNRFTEVEPRGKGILFQSGNLQIIVSGWPERGSK